jgi:hypothetical protein
MKILRTALSVAVIGFCLLAGSAQFSPAAALFGTQFGWMGNEKYMACLKYVGAFNASDYPGKDKNIRYCQRTYLPDGR